MLTLKERARRWGAAALTMLTIFVLSARPGAELPDFGWADAIIKKGGHVLGYGMLALAYWNGFGWERRRMLPAWGLAVLYGASDELHQAFVPGRHPGALDILVFDNLGAALALWLGRLIRARSMGAPRDKKVSPSRSGPA